jgi:anthranilate phosphoribosyltransferase
MDIRSALGRIAERQDLTTEQMAAVMRQIMSGGADDAQIGAFLMGMRLKGETIDEITGAVMVMRELATGVEVTGDHLVDIVGTGGDGANLFNVSTASTFGNHAATGCAMRRRTGRRFHVRTGTPQRHEICHRPAQGTGHAHDL